MTQSVELKETQFDLLMMQLNAMTKQLDVMSTSVKQIAAHSDTLAPLLKTSLDNVNEVSASLKRDLPEIHAQANNLSVIERNIRNVVVVISVVLVLVGGLVGVAIYLLLRRSLKL